jgi:hypothetical protein
MSTGSGATTKPAGTDRARERTSYPFAGPKGPPPSRACSGFPPCSHHRARHWFPVPSTKACHWPGGHRFGPRRPRRRSSRPRRRLLDDQFGEGGYTTFPVPDSNTEVRVHRVLFDSAGGGIAVGQSRYGGGSSRVASSTRASRTPASSCSHSRIFASGTCSTTSRPGVSWSSATGTLAAWST